MTRTMLSLAALSLVACSPDTPEDSALGLDVATKEEGVVLPPPARLAVSYVGADASVMVQVMRLLPDGNEQIVGYAEVVDDTAMVRLPGRVLNPPDAPTGEAVFKVVSRVMQDDGRAGAYLDVSTEEVVFVPGENGAPSMWYILGTDPEGKPTYLSLRHGMEVADHLRYDSSQTVAGGVAPELASLRFGLALLTDGDALQPAYTSAGMLVDGDTFSVTTEGAPPADTLKSEEGPASGRYWPVAWTDADGQVGFDPAADDVVGLTCLRSGVVSMVWSPAPKRLSEALRLVDQGLRAGWSLQVEGVDGASPLAPGSVPWLGGDCL